MIYPWQTTEWAQINRQRHEQRIPHALLISGPEGLGKLQFAQAFAHSLLCDSPDAAGHACGQCGSCKLIAAGTHPDLLLLEPETAEKAIKVDDIRQLCQSLSLTSQYEGYKIAIIASADNMNMNAANSLLKTLEEPAANTLLILVSSRPYRFPVTIRSRCQTIKFHNPTETHALQWLSEQGIQKGPEMLAQAHGSPLKAMQLAESESVERRKLLTDAFLGVVDNKPITEWSEKLAQQPVDELLGWLYDWLGDLIRQISGQPAVCYTHDQLIRHYQIQPVDVFALLDEVITLKKLQSIPLNAQMLWEDLLISWNRIVKRA